MLKDAFLTLVGRAAVRNTTFIGDATLTTFTAVSTAEHLLCMRCRSQNSRNVRYLYNINSSGDTNLPGSWFSINNAANGYQNTNMVVPLSLTAGDDVEVLFNFVDGAVSGAVLSAELWEVPS